jgi:hypothetical protein
MDLPNLAKNIRLGWKWPTGANTLAYYDTATITAVKSFIVQPLVVIIMITTTNIDRRCGQFYKTFLKHDLRFGTVS